MLFIFSTVAVAAFVGVAVVALLEYSIHFHLLFHAFLTLRADALSSDRNGPSWQFRHDEISDGDAVVLDEARVGQATGPLACDARDPVHEWRVEGTRAVVVTLGVCIDVLRGDGDSWQVVFR